MIRKFTDLKSKTKLGVNVFKNLFLATPFGKLPVFNVDHDVLMIPETIAIYHYIAAKHGGLPASIEDQVMCDAYGEHLQDYLYKSGLFHEAVFQNKPKEEIQKLHDEAVKYLKERIIPDLNKQLLNNGKGFLVGHEYTWVDFMAADIIDTHLHWSENADKDELGEVVKHRDRIFALPGLKNRLIERQLLFPPKEIYNF